MKVVCTGESQHGRSCGAHYICGTVLVHMVSYVCFSKTRCAWCDEKEEGVVEVFHIKEGRKTCEVGYLVKHLAFCADRNQYDGLCIRITEVYSDNCTLCESVAKRLKFHCNIGCCIAIIIGMKDVFVLY